MAFQPCQNLPDSVPLDIVGDVHGELEALQSLLYHLGYQANGFHPQGRCLVFVGDLCDRGQNSPAVLAWFKQAYDAGYAYMVLGNHELNLLAHDPKDGSGWFFEERAQKDGVMYAPWNNMPEQGKEELEHWLAKQPLVLQRDDIRIVHAAWLPEQIERIEAADGNLVTQYRNWDNELNATLANAAWYADYQHEKIAYDEAIGNPLELPPPMLATAEYELMRSYFHPFRALTSGVEVMADTPFYASGRWRFSERFAWWDNYTDSVPVVIGHYWRHWYRKENNPQRENLMPEQNNAWHGAVHNVFCIDYSVGARWRDRKNSVPVADSHFRLAALRWPENTLMFDNGETSPTC